MRFLIELSVLFSLVAIFHGYISVPRIASSELVQGLARGSVPSWC